MTTLQQQDSDAGSKYSDSFEIEEESLASSANSGTTGAVLSQLQKTLSSPPSKGILVNSDKPPLPGKWSTEQVDFSKTIRSPMKLNEVATTAVTTKTKTCHSGPKFKAAARKVQAMQTVSKRFNDSSELRDTVYNGWLAEKSVKIERERRSKQLAKEEQEERQRKKEMEMSQRASKAVEEWNATKENELQKKRRERSKEARRRKDEVEEKVEKREASKSVFEKWREVRTQELLTTHRERKRCEVEEKRKKEEEELEKTKSAKRAYEVWKSRKTEHNNEERKKGRERRRELKLSKQEQMAQKEVDSKKVVNAWEAKKKEENKTRRRDSTTTTHVHTRAWCPARSVKYDYPQPKGVGEIKGATSSSQPASEVGSLQSGSTYSISFDSSDADSSDSGSIALSTTEDIDRNGSPKGKRKTIQVCCQVLEYWCTCEDST